VVDRQAEQHAQVALAADDAAQRGEPIAAELLVLAEDLGELAVVDLAALELLLADHPGHVGLAQALLDDVEVDVGAVEVPAGGLDVEKQVMEAGVEVGPLLIEAQAGDEDAACGMGGPPAERGEERAAGEAGQELVDADAGEAQQGLLEADQDLRRI